MTNPRLRDTLMSEWVKLSTLHVVYLLLGLAAGIAVGAGALLAAVSAGDQGGGGALDPVAAALQAMPYANVIVAAMAVTLVTSEYSGGMMRLTLTVTPARWRLLGAKLLAVGLPALVAGALSAALAAAVGLRMLASRGVAVPPLGDGAVLAAILGAGVGTALVALMATCMAIVVRRSAAAVALINVLAFLPGILYALPEWWQRNVLAYLPTGASGSLVGTVAERSAAHLPAAGAYTVVCAWAALFVLAAGTALSHRDA